MPGSYSENMLSDAIGEMTDTYAGIGNKVYADALARIDKLGTFDLNECMTDSVNKLTDGFDPVVYKHQVKNCIDHALNHMWVGGETTAQDIVKQLKKGGSARAGLCKNFDYFEQKYAARLAKTPNGIAATAKASAGKTAVKWNLDEQRKRMAAKVPKF